MSDLLSLDGVCHSYRRGNRRLRVLVDVALNVRRGEIVAVVGARNEGKTTLLKIAAGLEKPDAGRVLLEGRDIARCSDEERARLLGDEVAWINRESTRVGFRVLDDLALPLVMGRKRGLRQAENLVMEALERVGVADCANQRWEELSNWERVVVGFARALVAKPSLMVVDDVIDGFGMSKTRQAGDLLLSVAGELGCGVLVSSSNMEPVLVADRVWEFERGALRLVSDNNGEGSAVVIGLHDGARQARGSLGTLP